MEVFKKAKASSLASFGISVFIHLAIVVLFGAWSFSGDKGFNLIKIPNSISVNLGGVSARSQPKVTSPKRITTTDSSQNTQAIPTNLAATSTEGSPEGTGTVTTGAGGTTEGSGEGSESEATILSAKQKYSLEFRNLVEVKKEYPTMVRMRGLEGVVVIAVTIKKNGEVSNHRVVKNSGHALLDQSALNLVKKIQTFKAFPGELPDDEIELRFPISYKLND